MPTKFECENPACKLEIDQLHIVCLKHWQELPRSVKDELNKRIRGWGSRVEATRYLSIYYKFIERKVA